MARLQRMKNLHNSTKRFCLKYMKRPFVFLLIGFVIGSSGMYMSRYRFRTLVVVPNFGHPDEEFYRFKNYTISNLLYRKVKVLCWMIIRPEISGERQQSLVVKYLWGKRCNKLLIFSLTPDSELGTITPPSKSRFFWNQTVEAIDYIYKHHFEDADWFLNVSPRMYVVMENLRYVLLPYDPKRRIHLISTYDDEFLPRYMTDAPGYVFSKGALKFFHEMVVAENGTMRNKIPEEIFLNWARDYEFIDDNLINCPRQKDLVIPEFKIKDMDGANRLCFESSLYRESDTLQACTTDSIVFHHADCSEMFLLDLCIYSLNPFGIPYNPPLPKELLN